MRGRWGSSDQGRVPIGRPIANARLYLLDAAMQPAPTGTPGELFIGGAGLARGYLNRPDLTSERFLADPFGGRPGARMYRTGDLARRQPDGEFEFLGRVDHQVKIRGFRIELGEIEAALLAQPGVKQAVVIAREDLGARQLAAYVVGRSAPGPEALRERLRETLPEPMVPVAVVALEAFPLTPNGKVDRQALPAPDRRSGEPPHVSPRTSEERLLAGIWEQVLRVERVGVHDNFFHLGGDSILSIQVIARANRAGLRLTPQELFQHQTIAGLAGTAGPVPDTDAMLEPVPGPVSLTPAQLWLLERESAAPHLSSRAVVLQGRGELDPVRLEQAVASLLQRHDALRLRFFPSESGWRQELAAVEGPAPFLRIDLATLPQGGVRPRPQGRRRPAPLEPGPRPRRSLPGRPAELGKGWAGPSAIGRSSVGGGRIVLAHPARGSRDGLRTAEPG